ncbi:toxin ParE1/3/4 [Devosia sp. UYZn731]|uniref:type II toxin-antitoxin system RelE/ParE family toxin n=1 Tax=Devosia sp. UYZn731 TaxID=3156345 RepID=UPI003397379C
MPLRIRRSAKARADQDAIWLYIATENLDAADQQIDHFHRTISMLADYPDAGRQRLEFDAALRAFPIDQYVLFYRVSSEILDIVRILHAARDITPDMLAD